MGNSWVITSLKKMLLPLFLYLSLSSAYMSSVRCKALWSFPSLAALNCLQNLEKQYGLGPSFPLWGKLMDTILFRFPWFITENDSSRVQCSCHARRTAFHTHKTGKESGRIAWLVQDPDTVSDKDKLQATVSTFLMTLNYEASLLWWMWVWLCFFERE